MEATNNVKLKSYREIIQSLILIFFINNIPQSLTETILKHFIEFLNILRKNIFQF